jgi:dCMP deaminase
MARFEDLDKWDKRFVELAVQVSGWSKDPSTKVGSIVVSPDRRVLSMGYNGFPRGVTDLEERLNDRQTKYALVAHAERNALDNADTSLRGCTLYVTLQPCAECTKSIIQKGIRKIVSVVDETRQDHYKNFVDHSLLMLEEAGVEVIQVTR